MAAVSIFVFAIISWRIRSFWPRNSGARLIYAHRVGTCVRPRSEAESEYPTTCPSQIPPNAPPIPLPFRSAPSALCPGLLSVGCFVLFHPRSGTARTENGCTDGVSVEPTVLPRERAPVRFGSVSSANRVTSRQKRSEVVLSETSNAERSSVSDHHAGCDVDGFDRPKERLALGIAQRRAFRVLHGPLVQLVDVERDIVVAAAGVCRFDRCPGRRTAPDTATTGTAPTNPSGIETANGWYQRRRFRVTDELQRD